MEVTVPLPEAGVKVIDAVVKAVRPWLDAVNPLKVAIPLAFVATEAVINLFGL